MSTPVTRRTLLGAAAAVGLSSGLWWALSRQGKPPSPVTPGAASPAEPLPEGFWAQQFDTLAGTPLALSAYRGKPLLINFWATWCPPCVKELPELGQFHREFGAQGWSVLGLAIDGPTPVKTFLTKTPVPFPVGLAGLGGTELALALGNVTGGLPFSVMVDAQGGIRHRKMGATTLEELSGWARALG